MPYRPKDIYRGRRKFRVPLNIFLFVLALLLFGGVTLFYVLQRYIVYDADGATLQLPGRQTEETLPEDDPAAVQHTFEPVEVQVVWEAPDFSDVDMGAHDDLTAVRGLFIPLDTVTNGTDLTSAVAAVTGGDYTTAVLEMKDRTGQLAWPSTCETALGYRTGGSADVSAALDALHEAGKTAAAQISCFCDWLLLQHNWTFALSYADGSLCQTEDGCYWLDPYNQTVRSYIIDMVRELAAMGFDEIILADLYHPVSENGFTYSETPVTEPDPVVAVCQAGQRIVEALGETQTVVSARLDAASLRDGLGQQTGQDLSIFWRLFGRLYCPTYSELLASDTELAAASINGGDPTVRFVPVMDALPEESPASYVLSWYQA